MPNIKISELPQVTSLLSTDLLPSVASSATSKVTLKNLADSLTQVSSSISASFSVTASYVKTSISSSYPISVTGSTLYSTNPASVVPAGNSTVHSLFLGSNAGGGVTNASYSNFIGNSAGAYAYSADSSNFLGQGAGFNAGGASYSNFIGRDAGAGAFGAPYSVFVGYRAGYGVDDGVGANNIIIGTNITLSNYRVNSINLGGIIFGTGSYSTSTGNPFSGSVNGRIGINQPIPQYSLDVSGSFRLQDGIAILTQVSQSLNFIDDSAAAAGGVPLGGLYRSGSVISIRTS